MTRTRFRWWSVCWPVSLFTEAITDPGWNRGLTSIHSNSMKPGKNDRKHQVLITGAELRELQRLDMPESLGLDRRIRRYRGARPIGLYRWDLDCLLATLSLVVEGRDPLVSPKGVVTLKALHDRLQTVFDAAYGVTGV
jgi:hypothetical protein